MKVLVISFNFAMFTNLVILINKLVI